ncbi:nucleosome assembly protein 1;2-like isoform X2 [Apium graveolens]|uniref:nucleosome assembly protein 1;2-like isoform X2 n=1 Tax=Apium graveolens TaxID=4045 RepID=UPI003D7A8713
MVNIKKETLDLSDLDGALAADGSALSAEEKSGLVNALRDKLKNLGGPHSDILESLTPVVRKRVEALKDIQSHHDDLEAKFYEEKAALEAKYQKLYEPLYNKRYEIVNGILEPKGVESEDVSQEGGQDKEKGVPEFWVTAMKTNEILAEEISERDEEALKYLKDIKWCKMESPKGFKLDFFFDTNPFFKNSVLTKIYHMINDEDEPILEKAIGTDIEWYPGKCLTHKILKKKPKKGSKNAKPITKTENCDSFFNFFSPPEVPEDDDDLDEDAAEELQNLMEQDYDIGSTIRDKIIPHAVSWFTGEAAQGDEFEDIEGDDEDDEGEEDDEDEEEDEEEDEDDDEDEDDVKNRKKKSGRSQAGEGQQGERPPECKQQ